MVLRDIHPNVVDVERLFPRATSSVHLQLAVLILREMPMVMIDD
jgi:hypothetical protein